MGRRGVEKIIPHIDKRLNNALYMSEAKVVERIGETDVVWIEGKPKFEHSDVLCFYQNEEGYAAFGACMGMLGERPKLVAKYFSKLMTVPPFNQIPAPLFPEWHLYETKDKKGYRIFFLRILYSHPTSLTGEEHDNAFVWLYTYPIFADIIKSLISIGVIRSTFFCANLLQENEMNQTGIEYFDFCDLEGGDTLFEDKEDIVLMPYSWIWSSVFSSFCGAEDAMANVVIVPKPNKFIDRFGMDLILDWGREILSLEWEDVGLSEAINSLNALENLQDSMQMDLSSWMREIGGNEGYDEI